jgi:hypothetical protein
VTDDEFEELIERASVAGVPSYPEVVPKLLREVLRLRRKLREMETRQATVDAARTGGGFYPNER